MPVIPSQTARRWAYVTWIALTAACAFILVHNGLRIADYDRRVARATETIDGVVVSTDSPQKGGDSVQVAWLDKGHERRRTFDVHDAGDFPVGAAFGLVREPGVDEVYPASWLGESSTGDLTAAMFGTVLGMLLLQVSWLVRFNAWRRAARAPVAPYRATLLLSFGYSGGWVAAPWLRLTDADGDTRFQRVMWEPWLVGWSDSVDAEVTAHRAGSGPFVVDVPGHGRLWPAGRARRRGPWLGELRPGAFSASSPERWFVLYLVPALVAAIMVGPFVGSVDFGNALLAGLVLGGFVVSAVLFYGGPPFYTRPRR